MTLPTTVDAISAALRGGYPSGRDHAALSDVMDFDHPITVHADGRVTDGPAGVCAPDVYMASDLSVTIDGRESWSLMHGYSGQDRYSGPVMHESEYIGGGMARDILSEPGTYAAVTVHYLADDDGTDDDDDLCGWAVARLDT